KQQTGFQRINNMPKIMGTVTHRILQMLALHGNDWWIKRTNSEKNQYLKTQLKQFGLSIEKRETASPVILQAIENTLSDERGRWILYSHSSAKSEYAISAIVNSKLENLIIDRTFIDEENTLWIIDYKTATFTDEDMHEFLVREQKKYATQMS